MLQVEGWPTEDAGAYLQMLSVLNIVAEWRALRESLDLTQSWVADRVGISRTALSHIETGKSTPSLKTQEALRRALDPFEDLQRFVSPGGPLEVAKRLRGIAQRRSLHYALTLDVAAWILTRYQTPSASWAYVRPVEEWVKEVLREGATPAPPTGKANLILLRAPEEVLRERLEVGGFLLAPLKRVVEDGANLGGRHTLDAARLYLEFREARRPGLRLDPYAVVKVWEDAGPTLRKEKFTPLESV